MPQIKADDLAINTPVEGAAPDTTLILNNDPAKPLPPGVYTFQLEVVDDSGNRSKPTQARVVIVDDQAPTAVITAPPKVPFGTSFTLSGKDSTDAGGGTIARYIWTRVS